MIDIEIYGGRRAYAAHLRARVLCALGVYRSAENIVWGTIARLVFVCHGNICRSPYACERARSLGVNSVSFGLDAFDGMHADESASRNALLRGIDLTGHRSARLQAPLLARGDLVVVFEPWQLSRVRQRSVAGLAGLTLLGIWTRPTHPYVHDPYSRSDRYFQHCFSTIDRNVHRLVTRIAASKAPAFGSGASRQPGVSFRDRVRRPRN